MALRLGYGRTGRLDLSLAFLHLDVLLWLLNLHHVEQSHLFFAYLLLIRVADQVGFGFRRAFYFSHVVVAAYVGYSVWVAMVEPQHAHVPERAVIAIVMYLLGIYLAFTGSVTERLRASWSTASSTRRRPCRRRRPSSRPRAARPSRPAWRSRSSSPSSATRSARR